MGDLPGDLPVGRRVFRWRLAAVASNGTEPGRLVSRVYAANTLGAIVGALVASLILVRLMGTQQAQKVLIAASAFAALFALDSRCTVSSSRPAVNKGRTVLGQAFSGLVILVAVLGCVAMLRNVSETPWELIAWGRTCRRKKTNAN